MIESWAGNHRIMAVTEWMDRRLYPSCGDNWDNKRFGELLTTRIEPHHVTLDFGAGRGALEELNLRGRAKKVVGVDLDRAVLENPALDEARMIRQEDGSIPYPDDSFDLVYSNNVMEHVPDPKACFRELYRVLQPGGLLVAKTPNKLHYVPLMAMATPHAFHVSFNKLRGYEAHDIFPTHYRCNRPRVVRRLARDTGFELVDLAMWEGRPEYLRILAPLYLMGYAYERLVNLSDVFSGLRCVMVFTLRKPGTATRAAALGES